MLLLISKPINTVVFPPTQKSQKRISTSSSLYYVNSILGVAEQP